MIVPVVLILLVIAFFEKDDNDWAHFLRDTSDCQVFLQTIVSMSFTDSPPGMISSAAMLSIPAALLVYSHFIDTSTFSLCTGKSS